MQSIRRTKWKEGENVIKSIKTQEKLQTRIHVDMCRLHCQTSKNAKSSQMLCLLGKGPDLLPGLFSITCEIQLCAGSCQYTISERQKKKKEWKLGMRGRRFGSGLSVESLLSPQALCSQELVSHWHLPCWASPQMALGSFKG